jgi:NADH-ubiquinone oxidoreductase chain 6
MNILLQDLFALGAILSSLLVITSKNPVISVLFLISVFVNAAVYLILIGVSFVGISYILIYVGAIAILFLFILMMINIKLTDILEVGTDYTQNLPLALMVGGLFIFGVFSILPFSFLDVSLLAQAKFFFNFLNSMFLGPLATVSLNTVSLHVTTYPFNVDTHLIDFHQIEALGHNLYTQSSFLLIFTSLILLLSMLAPIVLSSVSEVKNKNNS